MSSKLTITHSGNEVGEVGCILNWGVNDQTKELNWSRNCCCKRRESAGEETGNVKGCDIFQLCLCELCDILSGWEAVIENLKPCKIRILLC